MPQSTYCRPQAYSAFNEAIAMPDPDEMLIHAAIAISMHAHPETSAESVLHDLAELATRIEKRVTSKEPRAYIAHLHAVLFEEENFTGEKQDYYDPDNSYICRVLEERKGIPILLSLIYVHIARSLGLHAYGINTPGHFLAGIDTEHGTYRVDVFDNGRHLSRDDIKKRVRMIYGHEVTDDSLMPTAKPKDWIGRILRNLENIYKRNDDHDNLAAMGELQQVLNPNA